MCGNKCICLSKPTIDLRTHAANNSIGGLQNEDKVYMIYRKNIKVHFSSVNEASQANYFDYNKDLDLSKGGIVYPFTGIRGDSKELWFKVKQNKFQNIHLVKAETFAEQKDILSKSDIIVLACGY